MIFKSDLDKLIMYIYEKRASIIFSAAFFALLAIIALIDNRFVPILIAAILIRPLRFMVLAATYHFEEDSYKSSSPLIHNSNNYLFIGVAAVFGVIPFFHIYFGHPIQWGDLGTFAYALGAGSIAVLTWSEALYEKNFYFDRWHFVERGALVGLGVISIFSPLFIPLFLLIHRVVTEQFRHPEIGKFNYTHSALPHSMLFVISGFIISGLLFNIQEYMVLFLLLCAYSAHYFHSGLAKLQFGVQYYILKNNPISLFLNAYRVGWIQSLREKTVARIGVNVEKIKPLLNSIVIVIELGAVFILVSQIFSVLIGVLTLSLHLSIFLLTGDNFWKWMAVNLSLIFGLLLMDSSQATVFGEVEWVMMSLLFVILAKAWMEPQTLGWLDSPYYEHFSLQGELENEKGIIDLHPDNLRPYDSIISQGLTGTFTFLGNHPRITWSLGNIRSKEAHRYIENIYPNTPDDDEIIYLLEELGDDLHNTNQTKELEKLLESFAVYKDEGSSCQPLKTFSAPREFYTEGFRSSIENFEELQSLNVIRIDGIWTEDGFHEIDRTEVIRVELCDS